MGGVAISLMFEVLKSRHYYNGFKTEISERVSGRGTMTQQSAIQGQ